jgi:hypothetical protein
MTPLRRGSQVPLPHTAQHADFNGFEPAQVVHVNE